MPIKISALPTGTVASTDVIPVVKAGVTTGVQFGHTHPESEVTNLVADLAAKAAASHTHPESDITNLVSDLAGKAAASHTHSESDITNLTTDLAALQAKAVGSPSLTAMDQSSWSWDNQGGASVTQGNGIVYLLCPAGSVAENLRVRFTTAPSTPYKFATKMMPNPMWQNDFFLFGPCLRESATGKIISMFLQSGSGASLFVARKNTDSTHVSSGGTSANIPPLIGGPYFLRVGNNGTNITFEYSTDGVNYATLLSEAKGTFFTTGPDQVGIAGAAMNVSAFGGASFYSWDQS